MVIWKLEETALILFLSKLIFPWKLMIIYYRYEKQPDFHLVENYRPSSQQYSLV